MALAAIAAAVACTKEPEQEEQKKGDITYDVSYSVNIESRDLTEVTDIEGFMTANDKSDNLATALKIATGYATEEHSLSVPSSNGRFYLKVTPKQGVSIEDGKTYKFNCKYRINVTSMQDGYVVDNWEVKLDRNGMEVSGTDLKTKEAVDLVCDYCSFDYSFSVSGSGAVTLVNNLEKD